MSELWLNAKTFHPVHTFENGQCFRWQPEGDAYTGIIGQAVVRVEPDEAGNGYRAYTVAGTLTNAQLAAYFDEGTDYVAIETALCKQDKWLRTALSRVSGLRLLRQDPFEMLLSFIISSNNNIPKIRMSIEDLCTRYGAHIGTYRGKAYYAFPSPEALADLEEEDFAVKAVGYRAKSLYRTVRRLADENIDLTLPVSMPLKESVLWLQQFYGVGEKVAHCILLFGYHQTEAYPIDTWVKQMLTTLYGVEEKQQAYKAFIETYFVTYRGYAQQVLFYYMRSYYSKSKADAPGGA
jgi:N-glycosylase/DNA lyase